MASRHDSEVAAKGRTAPWFEIGARHGSAAAVVAVLVGDPLWEPPTVLMHDLNPMTGDVGVVDQTPHLAVVPRWLWNGVHLEELEPIGIRAHYYE